MVELETDRLRLRQFREDDLSRYLDLVGDPEVMRYIGRGVTLDEAGAWGQISMILGHWQLRGYGLWAIEHKPTGALLGRAGLYSPPGWPGLEVGWALCRAYWGQGYATEAGRAALDWGFGNLETNRIISCIQPANKGSIRVAQRLGETLLWDQPLLGIPTFIYGIERADWHEKGRK